MPRHDDTSYDTSSTIITTTTIIASMKELTRIISSSLLFDGGYDRLPKVATAINEHRYQQRRRTTNFFAVVRMLPVIIVQFFVFHSCVIIRATSSSSTMKTSTKMTPRIQRNEMKQQQPTFVSSCIPMKPLHNNRRKCHDRLSSSMSSSSSLSSSLMGFIPTTPSSFVGRMYHRKRKQQSNEPILRQHQQHQRPIKLRQSFVISAIKKDNNNHPVALDDNDGISIQQEQPTFTILDDVGTREDDSDIDETIDSNTEKEETFAERYEGMLPNWLIKKCYELDWIYPTEIQQLTFDAILRQQRDDHMNQNKDKKTDFIIQAETGSGKTLAYLVPCLSCIDTSRSTVQALIVVPTRELGLQVARVARRLASASSSSRSRISWIDDDDDEMEHDEMDPLNDTVLRNRQNSPKIMIMNVLQGSTNKRQRAWAWADPPHIVIGTPTELCDMIKLGGIKRYNSIQYVVVDEVDACLLNNNINVNMNYNSAATTTPLQELLSKYLSPTYDDGTSYKDRESELLAGLGKNTRSTSNNRPFVQQRTTIFCSATIPQIRHFMKQCTQNQWMLQEPQVISLYGTTSQHVLPLQIEHAYAVCLSQGPNDMDDSSNNKLITLKRIIRKIYENIDSSNDVQGKEVKILIFAESQRPMEEMARAVAMDLNKKQRRKNAIIWKETSASEDIPLGTSVVLSVLRFDDSISQRAAALDAFRGDFTTNKNSQNSSNKRSSSSDVQLRIMFSNELATRGIDIVDISHVIHYDLPRYVDTYVHRSGRTGRLGRTGQVISIVTTEEEFVLRRYTNTLGINSDNVRCIARQKKQPPLDDGSER